MKKTSLFLALCISATCMLTACGSGESKDAASDTSSSMSTDTATMAPAPMDTSSTMTDTSMMKDTMKKNP